MSNPMVLGHFSMMLDMPIPGVVTSIEQQEGHYRVTIATAGTDLPRHLQAEFIGLPESVDFADDALVSFTLAPGPGGEFQADRTSIQVCTEEVWNRHKDLCERELKHCLELFSG